MSTMENILLLGYQERSDVLVAHTIRKAKVHASVTAPYTSLKNFVSVHSEVHSTYKQSIIKPFTVYTIWLLTYLYSCAAWTTSPSSY